MGLVNYSDSDESGDDSLQSNLQSTTAPPPPALKKPAFEKVVDSTNSNKIKVSLPDIAPEDGAVSSSVAQDEPPAKRAKTTGALGSFSSLLPTPKNTNNLKSKPSSGSIVAQNQSLRATGRINLKTSATPAFSREPQQEPEADAQDTAEAAYVPVTNSAEPSEDSLDKRKEVAEVAEVNEDTVPAPKPKMFKPLSVSRKPNKRKPPNERGPNGATTSASPSPHNSKSSASTDVPPSKPKVSLFGTTTQEVAPQEIHRPEDEYQPMLDSGDVEDGQPMNGDKQVMSEAATEQKIPDSGRTNDLSALANTLGLSALERRQLFGRGGQPTNAQVAQFNLAQEYKHNQQLRENEESAPTHNPVKSIAPGKHSLQQLVSAAQTNKDALDESFARGKSNKKAAGSKYGW